MAYINEHLVMPDGPAIKGNVCRLEFADIVWVTNDGHTVGVQATKIVHKMEETAAGVLVTITFRVDRAVKAANASLDHRISASTGALVASRLDEVGGKCGSREYNNTLYISGVSVRDLKNSIRYPTSILMYGCGDRLPLEPQQDEWHSMSRVDSAIRFGGQR